MCIIYYKGVDFILILLGETTVNEKWFIQEAEPTLFSRIYFVKSGETYYKDDSDELLFKHNHIYILPSNKPYTMWQNPNDRLNCLYLHIDLVPFVLNKITEIDISKDDFVKNTGLLLSNIIQNFPLRSWYEIAEPISESLKLYLKNKNIFQIISQPIQNSLQFIAKNNINSISINNLSKEIGYSNEYFIRLFTKEVGTSPKQYILNNKMKLAEKSIYNGEKISNIATKLGYKELRSFSRTFKNHFGVSPNNYLQYYQFKP